MSDVVANTEPESEALFVKNLQSNQHKRNIALRKDGKFTVFSHEGDSLRKIADSKVITFDGSQNIDPFHAMLHSDQSRMLVLSNHNEGKSVADIDLEKETIVSE